MNARGKRGRNLFQSSNLHFLSRGFGQRTQVRVDAGRLASASAVEAFTAVLLQINVRYRARAAVRLTGLEGR